MHQMAWGERRISILGQGDPYSFTATYDADLGSFVVEGSRIHPLASRGQESPTDAFVEYMGDIAARGSVASIERMQARGLDPAIGVRAPIADPTDPRLGGLAYSGGPGSQTHRARVRGEFDIGPHPQSVAGGRAYMSPSEAAGRVPEWAHVLQSGLTRRPASEHHGALASPAEFLEYAIGYSVDYDEQGAALVTSPYKQAGGGKRVKLHLQGYWDRPNLYGDDLTSANIRGKRGEPAQGFSRMTEFVPGGLLAPGQIHMTQQSVMGMEMSMGAKRDVNLNYRSMAAMAEQSGQQPLGQVFGGMIGERQQSGAPFMEFGGIGYGMTQDQMRGTTGYTPMSARLNMPYGEGLYGLMETYMEKELSAARTSNKTYAGLGVDVLQQAPTNRQEIEATEAWVEQMRSQGLDERIVGDTGIQPFYYQGKRNEGPSLQLGAQVHQSMQSGTAWDLPGVKGATLIQESLTGMGADPRSEIVVGGDSMKGNLPIVSGLAEIFGPEQWQPHMPAGFDASSLYGQSGEMVYAGQKEVQYALEQMLGPNKELFQQQLEERGGFLREGWWSFQGNKDDPFLKQNPRIQEMLGTGKARYNEQGHLQMFLQSIGLPTVGSPIYPFRGRTGGLSLNALQDIHAVNPEAAQSFLNPERAPGRKPYLEFLQSAGQMYGEDQQFAPTATGQQPYALPLKEAWQSYEAEFGSEKAAAERQANAMPPLRHLLTEMTYNQNTLLPVESAAGRAVMGAESSLKLGEFDEEGRPISAYSIKQANLLSGISTGGLGPMAMSPLVSEFKKEQQELAKQPSVIGGALGGEITKSRWGRATYVGGGGLPEGEAAMVLPQRMIRDLGLGEEISMGDAFGLMRREPADVETSTANIMLQVKTPGQWREMQIKAGEDPISVQHFEESFGLGASGATMKMILSAFGLDFDKDLLEGLMLEQGFNKEQANAMMQKAFASVMPGISAVSKGSEMIENAGRSVLEEVQANAPGSAVPVSEWTGQALAGAENEMKTGLVSNMLDLMKEGMRTKAEGLGGAEKSLYQKSARAAEREIGQIKEDLIEVRRDEALPAMVTAAMSASAFKGARHGPYDITFLSGEHTVGQTGVRPKTQRMHPMGLFTEFSATALKQGMSKGGVAALFGGWEDEGGSLQGLPESVSQYIEDEARKPGSGRTPFMDDEEGAGMAWLESTPKGRLELGRLYTKSMNRMFYLDELGDEAQAWEMEERDMIRGAIETGNLDEIMMDYQEAYAPAGATRKAGAIMGEDKSAGLHKFGGLNRLVQGIQARAGKSPLLASVLGGMGILEFEAGERLLPSEMVAGRPRPLSRAEQVMAQRARQSEVGEQMAVDRASSAATSGSAGRVPQAGKDPYRPSNLGKDYTAILHGFSGWPSDTVESLKGEWEHERYETETLAMKMQAEVGVVGEIGGVAMEGTLDRYDPSTGDIVDRKTGKPTEQAIRRNRLQASAYRELALQMGMKVSDRIGMQYGKFDEETGQYSEEIKWYRPYGEKVLSLAGEVLTGQLEQAKREGPATSRVLDQMGRSERLYREQIKQTGVAREASMAAPEPAARIGPEVPEGMVEAYRAAPGGEVQGGGGWWTTDVERLAGMALDDPDFQIQATFFSKEEWDTALEAGRRGGGEGKSVGFRRAERYRVMSGEEVAAAGAPPAPPGGPPSGPVGGAANIPSWSGATNRGRINRPAAELMLGGLQGQAFEGLGQLNLDLMKMDVSAAQAGQYDAVVADIAALGQQGGFGTLAQKKRLMSFMGKMDTEDTAQGGIAELLSGAIGGTQWGAKLPKLGAGQGVALGATSGQTPGDALANFSQGLEAATKQISMHTEALKLENAEFSAVETLERRKDALAKFRGPQAIKTFAEQDAELRGKTGAEVVGSISYQAKLQRMQRGVGLAQRDLDVARSDIVAADMAAEEGGPSRWDIAKEGIREKFAGEKRMMSFFDLMYLQRLGNYFWGGMEDAGAQAEEIDMQMGRTAFQMGVGDGVGAQPMMQQRAALRNAQLGVGRAWNQAWGPFVGAKGGVQEALGPLSAIGGTAMGAGLIGSFFNSQFLKGTVPELGPAVGLIAAGVGLASYAKTQVDQPELAALEYSQWEEGRGAMPWFQEGFGLLGAFTKGAAGGAGRGENIFGMGIAGLKGMYDRRTSREAMVVQLQDTARAGYSKEALEALPPELRGQAQLDQVQRMSEELGMGEDQAAAMLGALMPLMPEGLTKEETARFGEAMRGGFDPGVAIRMFEAQTGETFAYRSGIDVKAMENFALANPREAESFAKYAPGINLKMEMMGFKPFEYNTFAGDFSGADEQMWQQTAGTANSMLLAGVVTADEAQGMVARNIFEGSGIEGEMWTPRRFEDPVAKQLENIRGGNLAQLAMRFGGDQGMVRGAVAAAARMPDDPRVFDQPDLYTQQAAAGNQIALSLAAQEEGNVLNQTWDFQTHAGTFQQSGGGLGATAGQWLDAAGVSRGGRVGQAYQHGFTIPGTSMTVAGLEGAQLSLQQQGFDIRRQQMGISQQRLTGQAEYQQEMWGLQDQMTSLGRGYQDFQWEMGGRRMDMQEAQFGQNMAFQRQQAGTQAEWGRQDIGIAVGRANVQRGWKREDWAVQDSLRATQWGWQQQDWQENIRFSTGRQRRLQVRGRERGTFMHQAEEEQIERERERTEQQEAWQDEDFQKQSERHEQRVTWQLERFDLSQEHFEDNMALNREAHEEAREFMLERREIEDDIRDLQRDWWKEQHEYNKQSLALQASQIDNQEELFHLNAVLGQALSDQKGIQAEVAAGTIGMTEAAEAFLAIVNAILAGVGEDQIPSGNGGGDGNGGSLPPVDPGCFVAGTLVNMSDWTYKRIEDIKVGDRVASFTDDLTFYKGDVTDVMEPRVEHTRKITFNNGQTVRVSDEHPFFTPSGWKKAYELKPGTKAYGFNGQGGLDVTVINVQEDVGDETVYNFTVGEHGEGTYIANSILVHNVVAKQHGGPVFPGKKYIVGEAGIESLEMFSGGGGRVTPMALSGGRGEGGGSTGLAEELFSSLGEVGNMQGSLVVINALRDLIATLDQTDPDKVREVDNLLRVVST